MDARFAREPALKRGFFPLSIDARLRGVRSRLKSGASTDRATALQPILRDTTTGVMLPFVKTAVSIPDQIFESCRARF